MIANVRPPSQQNEKCLLTAVFENGKRKSDGKN